MPRSGQEVVYEGWLTKSPPTKRIWRARWRKRWFSLQNSGELPGQYFLVYYTDRKCRKLKGTINLDHCEQVDTGLKFEDSKYKFDHMFDIKTPTRTYYLAAETEEEMKAWVNCICNICGLKATADDETAIASPICHSQMKPTAEDNNKVIIDSPPISPVSSGPYIPISECITGRLPNQGVEDFYALLQHNLKNSYMKVNHIKGHSNNTYDTTPPVNANTNSEIDSRFYDSPRRLHLSQRNEKACKSSELYYNIIKPDQNTNISPLQSPTDSESVFTDDDWSHNVSADNILKLNRSSCSSEALPESLEKISLDDVLKSLNPPPRPPKPSKSIPNYFNLSAVSTTGISKERDTNDVDENKVNETQTLTDETYDFPRSHQLQSSESLPNTLIRRHCYNNAAPVKIEGQIFRYDVSPKPGTSSQVFQYDNLDIQDEPSSPMSQDSASTTPAYSNLPSPALLSDTQLKLPPQINRSLKPKHKLDGTEPSSPRMAPSVDRSCKPLVSSQTLGMRRTFESESEHNWKIRTVHNSSPQDNLYGNQQMYTFYCNRNNKRGKGDLSSVQYLDLDHSISQYGVMPSKSQALRSPGASTVYKQVDFMKTEAFNITRQHLEMQRKEPVTYKK